MKTLWLCSVINHSRSSRDYLCLFFFCLNHTCHPKNEANPSRQGRKCFKSQHVSIIRSQNVFFYWKYVRCVQRHLNASGPWNISCQASLHWPKVWCAQCPLRAVMIHLPSNRSWWPLKCRAIGEPRSSHYNKSFLTFPSSFLPFLLVIIYII